MRVHQQGKVLFKILGAIAGLVFVGFGVQDGHPIVTKHSFPEEVLEDFKAERPVEIIYQANDPNTFVFASEKPSWTLIVIGAVVFVAAILLG